MSCPGIWLTMAALLLAGMVQGSSGFGFGLVAAGLLGIVLGDEKLGTILPIFASMTITGFMLWRFRQHLNRRTTGLFLLCVAVGVPLGVWLLVRVDEVWVTTGLAALLIFGGVYAMLPKHRRRDWHPVYLGVPAGLLCGALGGAFNTGGPPAVVYFGNRSMGRYAFVASLQAVFVLTSVIRLGSLLAWGMIDRSVLSLGLPGIVAAVVGCLAGNRLLHRFSDKHLRLYVCMFQLILGFIYALRAIGQFANLGA